MDHEHLKAIYGKYAGKILESDTDPVLAEIEKAASDNGLSLRVWWPGSAYEPDEMDKTRINVYLEHDLHNDKWKVGNIYPG